MEEIINAEGASSMKDSFSPLIFCRFDLTGWEHERQENKRGTGRRRDDGEEPFRGGRGVNHNTSEVRFHLPP